MANNKSAKKRIQIAERNRLINKSYKSTVRTLTKKTLENCEKYKKDPNDDNSIYIISVANNKSAKKRIQIAERNRLMNKSYKSTVRTLTKKTLENCEKYKKDPNEENKNLVKTSLNKAFSLIYKSIKKNVIHKNNGANKKSKINNIVKTTLTVK